MFFCLLLASLLLLRGATARADTIQLDASRPSGVNFGALLTGTLQPDNVALLLSDIQRSHNLPIDAAGAINGLAPGGDGTASLSGNAVDSQGFWFNASDGPWAFLFEGSLGRNEDVGPRGYSITSVQLSNFPSSVPEPATLGMIGLGIIGASTLSRRHTSRRSKRRNPGSVSSL